MITARGGSKRLPGKNIRLLGRKPLVVWSIDAVSGIPDICDILVSTDDKLIAAVCSNAGAYVPWLRPAELATDTASSVAVALHALDWYEAEKGPVDGLLLLQPTSPFRAPASVQRGIDLFVQHSHKPVLGVSATHAHPMWTLRIDNYYLVPFYGGHGIGTRSQDLPPAYTVNGCFYLISPAELRTSQSFLGVKTIPLFIESEIEKLDIDTEWDFKIAEMLVEKLGVS